MSLVNLTLSFARSRLTVPTYESSRTFANRSFKAKFEDVRPHKDCITTRPLQFPTAISLLSRIVSESFMTKKEIVRIISEEIGLTQMQTKEIVQKTFDAIVNVLASEGRIELRNFGVFEVKQRAQRQARNPKTGESVIVPERKVVVFKPGKVMDSRVNMSDDEKRFSESGFMPDARRQLDSQSDSSQSSENPDNNKA